MSTDRRTFLQLLTTGAFSAAFPPSIARALSIPACSRTGTSGGGPVVDNAEAGYDWSTYPELLQKTGISWKIYQDIGLGLTAQQSWGFTSDAYIGNYGNNSHLYFHQYQNAAVGTPLADGAKTGTDISVGGALFDIFRNDRRSRQAFTKWRGRQ